MYVMWAAQPLFMPKDNDKDNNNAYELLSVFVSKYSPATTETVTDTFTSKEISYLIYSHLQQTILLAELHSTLIEMKYDYVMKDMEFVWLCKQD